MNDINNKKDKQPILDERPEQSFYRDNKGIWMCSGCNKEVFGGTCDCTDWGKLDELIKQYSSIREVLEKLYITQQSKRLILRMVEEEVSKARIDGAISELERLDGYAYSWEYGEYQKERIKLLSKENKNGLR